MKEAEPHSFSFILPSAFKAALYRFTRDAALALLPVVKRDSAPDGILIHADWVCIPVDTRSVFR